MRGEGEDDGRRDGGDDHDDGTADVVDAGRVLLRERDHERDRPLPRDEEESRDLEGGDSDPEEPQDEGAEEQQTRSGPRRRRHPS